MLQGGIISEECTGERRILPIFFPPPITTYLDFPFQLSILLAHEKTRAWFYTNYIQIFSKLNSNSILLLHFWPEQYLVQHTQYFIDITEINESVVRIRRREIVRRICRWMDHGYYVAVMMSESALPGTMFYGKEIIPHPQFFFGYDLSSKSLKLTNFDQKGNYAIIDVRFSDFENALFSRDTAEAMKIYNSWGQSFQGRYPITLYKFRSREKFQYELDCLKIAELLEDYLCSRDTSSGHSLTTPRTFEYKNSQWGLGVYENLISYLQMTGDNGLDYRPFHGLWEHKKIMTSRLKYLEETGCLDPGAQCAVKFTAVENQANAVRLSILKSFYSGEPIHRETMISRIRRIEADERPLLSLAAEMLRNRRKEPEPQPVPE